MATPPSLIVIHCAATPNGQTFTVDDIRRWHTDPKPHGNGWSVAGYHYVIEMVGYAKPLVKLNDNEFLEPWEIANGARGYNGRSIHVCLIGTDQFTKGQWLALTHLTYELQDQFPNARIVGHNELNPSKPCPGFDVQEWLEAGRGAILEDHIL